MSRLQCILLTSCIVVGSLAAVPKPTQIQVLAKHGGAAQVHFLTASATAGEPHSTTGMIQVDRNGDLDIASGDGGAAGGNVSVGAGGAVCSSQEAQCHGGSIHLMSGAMLLAKEPKAVSDKATPSCLPAADSD